MKLKEIITGLEELVPRSLQEDYDNSGLIVGNPDMLVRGAVLCLDSLEAVVDEAIALNDNLVVAHHPLVFSGLKSLTGKDYIEKTIIKAIKNDVAIYAMHTNLDNVAFGVNQKLGEKLGLKNLRILSPNKSRLFKVVVFCPEDKLENLKAAVFNAGAGEIGNYSECSFESRGTGYFIPREGSKPAIGKIGELSKVKEVRLEILVESWKLDAVIDAMKKAHGYEEVAHYITHLDNLHQEIGAGMVGEFPEEKEFDELLLRLKDVFGVKVVRHTEVMCKRIKKVAFCGGSGSFLLGMAKREGADVFITSDFKYHQFFDANGQITIADIGHFESEQFTIELLGELLREKFPNFALHFTDVNTNPIKYFIG